MALKKKHEEHENHERWLVSYADFITLLFAFFVVMYAVSSVNEGKYRVLSDSMISAFQSPTRSMEPIQMGETAKSQGIKGSTVQPPVQNTIQDFLKNVPKALVSNNTSGNGSAGGAGGEDNASGQAMKQMANRIEQAMAGLISKDLVAVSRNDLWVEVEIKTSILFPSGSAGLQKEAVPVLQEISRILRDFPNPVRVEGFTDNVPISTHVFPSNWELSAARAASVVHLFQADGIDPLRMAAIGYGEYRPVVPNDTAEGRNKNRRVVLVILENSDAERLFNQYKKNQEGHLPMPQGGNDAHASLDAAADKPQASNKAVSSAVAAPVVAAKVNAPAQTGGQAAKGSPVAREAAPAASGPIHLQELAPSATVQKPVVVPEVQKPAPPSPTFDNGVKK